MKLFSALFKPFYGLVLTLIISACFRPNNQDPSPNKPFQPEFKAGEVVVFSFPNQDGVNTSEYKDSVVAPLADKPDSVVAIRLRAAKWDPTLGRLIEDPMLRSANDQIRFVRLLLTDPDLAAGPDPINFHTLNQTLRKLNLTINDLLNILDTSSNDASIRHYEFILEASKKLLHGYPDGFGVGADFEDFLKSCGFKANDFFSAVESASLSDEGVLNLMESKNLNFNALRARLLAENTQPTVSQLTRFLTSLNNDKSTRWFDNAPGLNYNYFKIISAGRPETPTLMQGNTESIVDNTGNTTFKMSHLVDPRFNPKTRVFLLAYLSFSRSRNQFGNYTFKVTRIDNEMPSGLLASHWAYIGVRNIEKTDTYDFEVRGRINFKHMASAFLFYHLEMDDYLFFRAPIVE